MNIEITGATLLSTEEAERLPKHLRKYGRWWWLRSPGDDQSRAAIIEINGSVFYFGDNVCSGNDCVRPALKISNSESADLQIGDKFEFGGVEFEVISDDLAFCVTDIGCCAFRENWEAGDANDYEVSDIKKFVDDWFRNVSTKSDPQTHSSLNIDYELLYKQREDLLKVSFGKKEKVDPDTIEGLIGLCDALLDEAEENGEFQFPEADEE